MTEQNAAGAPQGRQAAADEQGAGEKGEAQPPTVTGVTTDTDGAGADVPAGTEPKGVSDSDEEENDDGLVAVKFAHFWTDPDTGKNYGPHGEARLDPDVARSLRAAKYLLPE